MAKVRCWFSKVSGKRLQFRVADQGRSAQRSTIVSGGSENPVDKCCGNEGTVYVQIPSANSLYASRDSLNWSNATCGSECEIVPTAAQRKADSMLVLHWPIARLADHTLKCRFCRHRGGPMRDDFSRYAQIELFVVATHGFLNFRSFEEEPLPETFATTVPRAEKENFLDRSCVWE